METEIEQNAGIQKTKIEQFQFQFQFVYSKPIRIEAEKGRTLNYR